VGAVVAGDSDERQHALVGRARIALEIVEDVHEDPFAPADLVELFEVLAEAADLRVLEE
jgi:hypothetical protein